MQHVYIRLRHHEPNAVIVVVADGIIAVSPSFDSLVAIGAVHDASNALFAHFLYDPAPERRSGRPVGCSRQCTVSGKKMSCPWRGDLDQGAEWSSFGSEDVQMFLFGDINTILDGLLDCIHPVVAKTLFLT